MLKYIAVFLFIFNSFLFGAPNASSDLQSLKPQTKQEVINKSSQNSINVNDLTKLSPSDEMNLGVDDSKIYQKVKKTALLLSISNTPKKVFVNQVFSIDLSADIQQNLDLDVNLTVNNNKDIIWLNKEQFKWQNSGNGLYKTKLWFEATATTGKINNIEVVMNKNGEFFQKSTINFNMPTFVLLKNLPQDYSNLVANRLTKRNFKVSSFDETSNILTMELNIENGNFASLYIDNPTIKKQGVDSVKGLSNNQDGYFFAILDKNVTNFGFSYYNLMTNSFENISVPVKAELETLSTQSGINPKESSFGFYKNIVIGTVIGIFIVMFLLSRNTTPLIFAILLGIFAFVTHTSYETANLAKNSKIRILPIQNSTIFYITPKDEKVEIFAKTDDYYKVYLDDGKIGWVDKNQISK